MAKVRLSRFGLAGLMCGICLLALLAGCHAAPDMKPFTLATAELSTAVKAAGRAVGDELTAVTATWPDDQRTKAEAIKSRFERHWVERGNLADALRDYSESLAAIVAAGEQGEESAKALSNSFGQLCSAVGVVLPGAGAATILTDAASKVAGMLIRDRAALKVGGNMKNMQPVLDEVVDLLEDDLASIENGLLDLRVEARQTLDESSVHGMLPRTERNSLFQDTERQSALRIQMAELAGTVDGARDRVMVLAEGDRVAAERAAGAPDDRSLREAATVAALNHQAAARELASLESALEALRRLHTDLQSSMAHSLRVLGPVDALIADAETRIDAEAALVRAARSGLKSWSHTHAQLADAALERKPVRVEDLVEIAVEIRELVKEVRSSRK